MLGLWFWNHRDFAMEKSFKMYLRALVAQHHVAVVGQQRKEVRVVVGLDVAVGARALTAAEGVHLDRLPRGDVVAVKQRRVQGSEQDLLAVVGET